MKTSRKSTMVLYIVLIKSPYVPSQQNILYPKSGKFCEENFLRHIHIHNYALPEIEDLPSIIGCEPNYKSYKNFFSQNLSRWGKGYFAALGTFNVAPHNPVRPYINIV